MKPTSKQIKFLLSLIGARYESDAYRYIGQVCGISMSAAQSRATKDDASRAIDAALKARGAR